MTGLSSSDGEWFEMKGLDIRMPRAIAGWSSIGASCAIRGWDNDDNPASRQPTTIPSNRGDL
jgi:hypothetical protein